jgi:hypothetical protein
MFVGGVGVVEIWGVGIAVAAHNSNTLVVVQAGNTEDSVVPAESVAVLVVVTVAEKTVKHVVEQLAVLVVVLAAGQVVVFVNQVALKVFRMKIRSKEVWCRQLSR